MKNRFHVFVWPSDIEGPSRSAVDYYQGSFETLEIAIKNPRLMQVDGYCEILESLPDGSLKLAKSGFEQNGQMMWVDPE